MKGVYNGCGLWRLLGALVEVLWHKLDLEVFTDKDTLVTLCINGECQINIHYLDA